MSWTFDSARYKLWRDAVVTTVGLVLVIVQSFQQQPKDILIVAGLALTGIGASFHVGHLVSGQFGSRTSHSPSSPSRRSSPEDSDDD